jgi:2-keto-3-deoxy-L-rhamnonate aldolase RhmA
MVPQVHGAAEAREAASWLRSQPAGRRGVALFTRGMGYGSRGHAGVATEHERLLSIVQVESRAALEDVEAMAAVEGIDVLFVGPTDLSHALGIPGQLDDPRYSDAIARVASAARRAGKVAGVLLWRPDDVARYAVLGFTFFAISSDGSLLDRAIRAALDTTRQAVVAARPS